MVKKNKKGMFLVTVMVLAVIIALFLLAITLRVNKNLFNLNHEKNSTIAFFIADGVLEQEAQNLLSLSSGFTSDLYDNAGKLASKNGFLINTTNFLDQSGNVIGTYKVRYTVSAINYTPSHPFSAYRDVTIEVVAYVKNVHRSVTGVFRFGYKPTEVFNYAYFINHWGWMSGFNQNDLIINGNVRSNSIFTIQPSGKATGDITVKGNPEFDYFTGSPISLLETPPGGPSVTKQTGGVYAGLYVEEKDGARFRTPVPNYYSGTDDHKHNYLGPVKMPNVSDITDANGFYQKLAKGQYPNLSSTGTLKVGATDVITTGVYAGTNVILVGTEADPITINGPVVIPGDLIIKGVIKGKGTIYVGRNIYFAGDIVYSSTTGPDKTGRPSFQINPANGAYMAETVDQYKARMSTWVSNNSGKDAVGLVAKGNVVYGDITNGDWWPSIGDWLIGGSGKIYNSMDSTWYQINNGAEDIGLDGIAALHPVNSPAGKIADKEGDNKWSVKLVNNTTGEIQQMDLTVTAGVAQVPVGWTVIKGSGEDVDGDGLYTPQYKQSDFTFGSTYNAANYPIYGAAFNATYANFCSDPKNIVGAIYSNHAIAGHMFNAPTIFGSIVAKNEAMYTSVPMVKIHDERFNYQGTQISGLFLPGIIGLEKRSWKEGVNNI